MADGMKGEDWGDSVPVTSRERWSKNGLWETDKTSVRASPVILRLPAGPVKQLIIMQGCAWSFLIDLVTGNLALQIFPLTF